MDLSVIVELFRQLNENQLIVLAVLKVVTSLVVAVQTGTFETRMFGDMFKDDFLKLATILLLLVLAPSTIYAAPVVAVYVAYLGARVFANLGMIFPTLGERLPEQLVKTATPNNKPE